MAERAEIWAIKPDGGYIVHLHQAGYQPSKKPRPDADIATLCNAHAGQVRVPLAYAAHWPQVDPATAVRQRLRWQWCRPCIGHLAAIHGLEQTVVDLALITRDESGDHDG